MDREVSRQLEQANWGEIGEELLGFVIWRLGWYDWESGTKYILPGGNTPEDIVQHIIIKTIRGERRWDPNKGELVPWLRDQARSVIDALAESRSHRNETGIERNAEGGEEPIERQLLEPEELQLENPEVIILKKERAVLAEQKITALVEAVDEEPELDAVVEAIMNGCEPKPQELAKYLNTEVPDINNRLKRLRRKATRVLKEQER